MGYKFQFVTLAGFHSINFGIFELARKYKDHGMAAYSELQQAEFKSEQHGYTAVRHQREVGTGYFDLVTMAVTGKQYEKSCKYVSKLSTKIIPSNAK
jgi:isocitrate lyase